MMRRIRNISEPYGSKVSSSLLNWRIQDKIILLEVFQAVSHTCKLGLEDTWAEVFETKHMWTAKTIECLRERKKVVGYQSQ